MSRSDASCSRLRDSLDGRSVADDRVGHMPFAPFYKKFFDVADAETRAVIAAGDSGLPRGRYPFIEFYCNEPGCDCRRVIIHVMNENTRSLEAEISFGWESREFYREWMGDDDPEVLAMMQGPAFNIGGAVGEYADVLLELFRQTVRDPAYVDRLKRHYAMYRATVDRETPVASGVRRDAPKIGRNDPCPCGSGKKFKRCCDR